ncbi:InlB B-repeat-containing protein [Enterococcus sp. LJL99]
MKKRIYFILSMIMMIGVLFFWTSQVEAVPANGYYRWGQGGISTIVDPSQPQLNIAKDTVQLSFNPANTTYKFGNEIIKGTEIPKNGKSFTLYYNRACLEISNVGNYKGEMLNLQIYNANDKSQYSTIIVKPDGSVTSVVDGTNRNTYAAFYYPMRQFRLKFVDSNGNPKPNIPVLLTQTQQNSTQYNSETDYGFDAPGFNQLFGLKGTEASNSYIAYRYYNDLPYLAIQAVTTNMFTYAYYGNTSAYGEIFLYVGQGTYNNDYRYRDINYSIFNPTAEYSLIPLVYPNTNSSVADQTTDKGKYINITTSQLLVKQKNASFYPTAGSLNLAINESNIDYLQVTKDDFTLLVGDTIIPNSGYSISVNQTTDSSATININLLGSFASQYAGQTLTVKQKSLIYSDPMSMNSLVDSRLPIAIGTQLTYKMSSAVQTNTNMSVLTNKSDFKFTVVPELTAKLTDGYTVNTGTTLYDIPLEDLVRDMNNTYFPWDEVSAGYQNTNQTLTTGANKVNIVLKSDKFNYTQIVTATVNVADGYKLTYDGNGGTLNGQTTTETKFTKDGTSLMDGSQFVRKGYTFTGWSTTANGAVSFKAGYNYGTLATEQKDTTLYACWKKVEYKLTYNGNGGTVNGKAISDDIPFTVDGVKLLDASKVIRKGYTFTGWSTTATGVVAYQADYIYGKLDTEMKDTTLYACWKIDQHTLTYNGNGGTIDGQATTKVPFTIDGIKLLGEANVVRENYTFLGWSTSPTDSTKLLKEGYTYGTIDAEMKDTTLYACWEETTRITVSWNADKIETSTTKKVDRADSTSTMSFYWNSNKKNTQYLIKQKVANQQTDLKKIIQEDDTDALKKDQVEINTEKLAYGDNQMTLEFYQLDATGKVLTSDKADAILNLTIAINGSLRLESVPDSLYWTNRSSDSSIGILDRDTNNDIELSVVDSRENQNDDWSIQANLTMVEEDIPFGFVWKSSTSSSDVPMNESPITIMDKNSASHKGSYEYSQTWNDKLGVLLQSHRKISEGNYSGKVIVNWTITEGPI